MFGGWRFSRNASRKGGQRKVSTLDYLLLLCRKSHSIELRYRVYVLRGFVEIGHQFKVDHAVDRETLLERTLAFY